jgi:hypothetical protein
MADSPLGITFMPTADAAANGPKQASIEGQGGNTDLAAAFKILSLHLPRVLGASAIAPKRLLTSGGSSAVATPAGSSPYAAVFQSLLQSMAGGGSSGGGPDLGSSMASIYGAPSPGGPGDSSPGFGGSSAPPPNITVGDVGRIYNAPTPDPTPTQTTPQPDYGGYSEPDPTGFQYI